MNHKIFAIDSNMHRIRCPLDRFRISVEKEQCLNSIDCTIMQDYYCRICNVLKQFLNKARRTHDKSTLCDMLYRSGGIPNYFEHRCLGKSRTFGWSYANIERTGVLLLEQMAGRTPGTRGHAFYIQV